MVIVVVVVLLSDLDLEEVFVTGTLNNRIESVIMYAVQMTDPGKR